MVIGNRVSIQKMMFKMQILALILLVIEKKLLYLHDEIKMNIMTKENRHHLWEAISYVFLLVFFTYTAITVEVLKDINGLWDVYAQNQASPFGLLTNFGLLLLLVIDYASGKSKVDSYSLLRMSLCFFVYVVVFGHAKVVANPLEYSEYKILLAFPSFFIFLHMLSLVYLVYIKYQTLKEYTVSQIV